MIVETSSGLGTKQSIVADRVVVYDPNGHVVMVCLQPAPTHIIAAHPLDPDFGELLHHMGIEQPTVQVVRAVTPPAPTPLLRG